MKKCPFCAEEIQEEAVKCKHCGEWINATQTPQLKPTMPAQPKPKRPPMVLINLGIGKMLLYIVGLAIAPIIYDALLGISLRNMNITDMTTGGFILIVGSLYIALGVWVGNSLYKLNKMYVILPISAVLLVIARLILVSIYKSDYMDEAVRNTICQVIAVYGGGAGFGWLFRKMDGVFWYADVKNAYDMKHPITGKEETIATCCNCGNPTQIAKQHAIKLIGKRSAYFCTSCGVYIQGSPFNSIFLGISEAIFCFFMLGSAVNNGSTSSNNGIMSLFILVGIYDGFKRIIMAISGLVKKTKPLMPPPPPEPAEDVEFAECTVCGKSAFKSNLTDGGVCPSCII